MPNWCTNEVTVYANSKQDLLMLLSMARQPVSDDDDPEELQSKFRMESIHTTPSELLDDNGDDGWYGWRRKNWGCKWDMSDVELDEPYQDIEGKHYIELRYQTPWSPNIEFWKYVCKMGPFTVEMRYVEEGIGYIGETTIERDTVDDYCTTMTTEMLESVGGVLGEDGEIDWDVSDINEWDLFPLRKEKVNG
jgi:hypothetical protein